MSQQGWLPMLGGWYLELPVEWHEDESPVKRVSLAAASATSILADEGLLLPQQVRFRGWIEESADATLSAGLEEFTLAVPSADAAQFEYAAVDFATRSGRPTAIPELVVEGVTEVLSADGVSIRISGACKLSSTYEGGGITIFLATYSDVWLPYDLAGRPQPELAKLNAPRLAKALSRLSVELDCPLEPAGQTKYAIPVRNGLQNLRDVDGELVVRFER